MGNAEMGTWRRDSRGRRRFSTATFVLALTTSMPRSAAVLPSSSLPMPAFVLSSVRHSTTITHKIQHALPHSTICYGKLNKLASTFDLDEILSNEKEPPASKKRSGRNRNLKKDKQKWKMKEQQQKQRLKSGQSKQRTKTQPSSEPDKNTTSSAKIGGEIDDEPGKRTYLREIEITE